jgi:hypothetical protein
MKTILVSTIITLLFAFNAADKLTGRWESQPSSKGNVTGVVFKEDSSFEGYVNKKPFVTGAYSYSPGDSVLTFTDNGCNGATGIYKVNFFNNADSLRFVAITDTCTERRNGMQRLIMGRVK